MPVTLDAPALPAGVTPLQELTAYRVIQESLTNAFRHGDRSKGATVSVRSGEGGLTIRVTSALSGDPLAPSPHTGRGIPGMKERATAVGGSLTAVTAGTRFDVEAVLP
jgi:signal transduction histidine kinase